jgi:hypothetical protein
MLLPYLGVALVELLLTAEYHLKMCGLVAARVDQSARQRLTAKAMPAYDIVSYRNAVAAGLSLRATYHAEEGSKLGGVIGLHDDLD